MNFIVKAGVLAIVLNIAMSGIPIRAQEAQDAAGQINALVDTLGDLHTKVTAVNATMADLTARRRALAQDTRQLDTDIKAFADKQTDLSGRQAAFYKKYTDKKCGKKCQDALKPEGEALVKEGTDLTTALADLHARDAQVEKDSLVWHTEASAATTTFNGLESQVEDTLAALSAASKTYGVCVDRYPKDDDAGLKQHCGTVAFDNVRVNIQQMRDYRTKE